jgi:hypothetical protein
MLVLTRKVHQSIMIGDDVEVSLQSIMGDKVRSGHGSAASNGLSGRGMPLPEERERPQLRDA